MSLVALRRLSRLLPGSAVVCLAALLPACSRGQSPEAPVGYTPFHERPQEDDDASAVAKERPPLPDDVVEKAAQPFHGLTADGTKLPAEDFVDVLSRKSAICVAEHHDDAAHHWAQWRILAGLVERSRTSGRSVAVGFEMFQRPFQKDLDRYVAGGTEAKLLKDTQWESRWGFDIALYRPVLQLAREHRLKALALNLRKELTRKIAREGIGGLDEKEYTALPRYDLHVAAHRSAFMKLMAGHPHPPASKQASNEREGQRPSRAKKEDPMERMYAAQVMWDETMAQTAARHLLKAPMASQVVLLAGAAHCRRAAIPDRLERRGIRKVVSVRPILETDTKRAELRADFDYFMVLGSE